MSVPFLNTINLQEVMAALCRTFIHSLWMGILMAVLAGLVLASTKYTSSLLRYRLLSCLLICFCAACGLCFFIEMDLSSPPLPVTSVVPMPANSISTIVVQEEAPTSLLAIVFRYCTEHASILFSIWSVFFLYRLSRLVAGLGQLRQLRIQKTQPLPAHLLQKLQELKDRMGIGAAIHMVQSGLVTVPVTLGFLKPLILLPIGLITQLPPAQVEAILIHELAHIRRKDYLFNLLQSIAETVFFFNPCILWISSLLRQEREACCDAVVMQYSSDKQGYVEALVSFQEPGYSRQLVIGFGSRKMLLLDRVKRLMLGQNKKLEPVEKLLLGTAMVVLIALVSITQGKATASSIREFTSPLLAENNVAEMNVPLQDTPKKKEQKPLEKPDKPHNVAKKVFPPVTKNAKPRADSMAREKVWKKISADNSIKYEPETGKASSFSPYKPVKQAPSKKSLLFHNKPPGLFSPKSQKHIEPKKITAPENKMSNKFDLQVHYDLKLSNESKIENHKAKIIEKQFNVKEKEWEIENRVKPGTQARKGDQKAAPPKPINPIEPVVKVNEDLRLQQIKIDLLQLNIIERIDDVTNLILNGKEFVVNGIKLSEGIHEQFVSKYNIKRENIQVHTEKKRAANGGKSQTVRKNR
jgi:bla regulator protein blaR1